MNIKPFPLRKRSIYIVDVTLLDVRPRVWRRLQLPGATRLDRVHQILQHTLGWQDCHCHQFRAGEAIYSEVDPDFNNDFALDESDYSLSDLLINPGDEILYEYDFGDGWEHRIELIETLPIEDANGVPVCLDGDRACPPEDVGGPPGYQHMLKVLANPSHPEYRDYCQFIPDDYEPDWFDLDDVNDMLLIYFGESEVTDSH